MRMFKFRKNESGNKQTDGSDNLYPHLVFRNLVLLVDDFFHKRINNLADATEMKTGTEKKSIAFGVLWGGTALTLSYDISINGAGFDVIKNRTMNSFGVCFLNENLEESEGIENHLNKKNRSFYEYLFESTLRFFLKVAEITIFPGRMVFASYGLIEIVRGFFGESENSIIELNNGIYYLSLGIFLYLISSSNGTLDKVKSWFGEIAAYYSTPKPQTVNE